jgi:uncharacterized protein HemX
MYFANANATEIFTIAGAVVGAIVLLGLLAAGFGFLLQSFRSGKDQKTAEQIRIDVEEDKRKERVDKTLSDLVDAQEKRYVQLEGDHKENIKQIGILTGKIEEQSKQQKWFESIFISALDKFFRDNPDVAHKLDGTLKRGKD